MFVCVSKETEAACFGDETRSNLTWLASQEGQTSREGCAKRTKQARARTTGT
jgi:hypothetical protein